ncbi:MAG: hypothetical protein WCG27_01685 [Pseudomonadota bacterium]
MVHVRVRKIIIFILTIFIFKLVIGDRLVSNKNAARTPAQSIVFKK